MKNFSGSKWLSSYSKVSIAKLDSGMNLTFKRKNMYISAEFIHQKELSEMLLETVRYTMDIFDYNMDGLAMEMENISSIQFKETDSISITTKIIQLNKRKMLTLFINVQDNGASLTEFFWQIPVHKNIYLNSLN